jgi:methylenetetrahydrofolate dehydrogenase (NADP+)/methenyltetrahydrofolate cyclohydrolase
VSHIEPAKDVDGLTPATLRLIYEGGWQEAGRVVPATCMAVHLILHRANPLRQARRVTILGKSDLMGSPLQAVLYEQGYPDVELLGRAEIQARLAQPPAWKGRQVVISATGVPGLVRNADLDYDTIVIDVGEPRGDVEVASLTDDNVQFLSPVPGGVGPMTVQCLLENALELCTTKLIEPLTPIP